MTIRVLFGYDKGVSFLNDPVTVTCRFQNGHIAPLAFEWNHRQYKILRTVFRFKTALGTEPIRVFSCETREGVFDLTFNLKTLSWRIRGIHQEP